MTQENKKYLFDLHNFDDGPEFDPDNPPPPVFSQEELADAKTSSFEDGVKKGLSDAAASREREVTDIVRRLSQDIGTLLQAENIRSRKFEEDVIMLTREITKKLFPILAKHFGAEQIEETIKSILTTIGTSSVVTIEVAPTDHEEIAQALRSVIIQHEGQVMVIAQPDIEAGSFRIKWKDGGAVRDADILARQMTETLDRILAESLEKAQN